MVTLHYRYRLLIFVLLLTLPMLRLVLNENEGLLHPEVGIAILLLIGCAVGLSAATFHPFVFHLVAIGTVVLFSVNAIHVDLIPGLRVRWIVPVFALFVAVMTYVGREHYYKLLCIFVAGSFSVDVGRSLLREGGAKGGQVAQGTVKRNHVVHIILDETIGLAAMPDTCSSCQLARAELTRTLREGNFQIYPYAFSNYDTTRDSIPSILNGHLIHRADEYFSDLVRPVLDRNEYFDKYIARQFDIRVYQSDHILYSSQRRASSIVEQTYSASNLKALRSIDAHWSKRVRQLIAIFLHSDRFWSEMWTNIMPAPFELEPLLTGPLALQEVWPKKIADDIRRAPKDTLFFAHLLIPHFPYIYRRDGSVRKTEEWEHRFAFYRNEEHHYRSEYERYGEQVLYVHGQIATFLNDLRSIGSYDSTTILIHGDHGSKLRIYDRRESGAQHGGGQAPDSDSSNLRNRFATLLAIKPAGAIEPVVVSEKGSLLFFLNRDLLKNEAVAAQRGINSVYLFDEARRPVEIPMERLWDK